jgi:protoheme IX farnesyltransferase
MLPVVQPDGWSTVAEALFFAVVMIPVSLLPWYLGVANTVYAVLAVLLGLLYLAYTIRFAGILHAKDETESRMLARDLLKVSVLYLPLLFTTLMLCATQKHYSGFDSGAYRRIEAKWHFSQENATSLDFQMATCESKPL